MDQRKRIADLERRGLDTKQAEAILATFETTLRILREDLAGYLLEAGQPRQ